MVGTWKHCSSSTGTQGRPWLTLHQAKTLYRLRDRFYWPKMAADVRSFIASCYVCKVSKAPNSTLRPNMGKAFVIERLYQHIYIDFLEPYRRSSKGNTHIIVCLDQLTKFATRFLKELSRYLECQNRFCLTMENNLSVRTSPNICFRMESIIWK